MCATTRKQIEAYKEVLKALGASEDKVHDSLYEGILDRESFKRQVDRVRNERLNLATQLERVQLNFNGAYKETAKSIIELATNLKSFSGIGFNEQKKMVPRAGIEPARFFRTAGFSYRYGFRRQEFLFAVWTISSPCSQKRLGARVSSLYGAHLLADVPTVLAVKRSPLSPRSLILFPK